MALEIVFWAAAGLIIYAHLGYPLLLWVLANLFGEDAGTPEGAGELPRVTLVIPAYDEEEVIERKLANARALDYPAELLEIVVASDGSSDRTAELARSAGADRVLELPRGGKVAALNAAVEEAAGAILAFSDANSYWQPEALRRLIARFADERVGYACGQVRFAGGEGGNQEGVYWRYEMAVRSMETRLAGITAGNGAIYAFRRKRRMMWGLWDVMLRWGMLDPRGYGPAYALEIYSHRLLRYLTPWLHLVALAVNVPLLSHGWVYVATMALQAGLLVAAALGRFIPALPLRIAYYYVTVTASIAVGLWDRLRAGAVPIGWEKVEGTR